MVDAGTLTNVAKTISDYMIKGWVLTDTQCPNSNCNVPLMRSAAGTNPVKQFCVDCDVGPDLLPSMQHTDVTVASSSSSIAPSSDTDEVTHRIQRLDDASSKIGDRLLKGWAMLADECPNEGCYSVPLVRPPNTGDGKDPRKECVVCGNVYITEGGAGGPGRLVLLKNENSRTTTAPVGDEIPQVGKNKSKPAPVALPLKSTNSKAPSTSPLEVSAQSLELTVQALSEMLLLLSKTPEGLGSISPVADIISKVIKTLSEVRKLQSSHC